jgi:hypothetical protein
MEYNMLEIIHSLNLFCFEFLLERVDENESI